MNRQTYASDSKEKKKEYYENWKAKKLAQDPYFFKHNYERQVARYGIDYFRAKSNKWHHAHPEVFVKFREEHPGYHAEVSKRWRANNREKWAAYVREWIKAHPEIERAQIIANYGSKAEGLEPVPMAEFCETCPEDDIRKATQKHHPDYNYPTIIVSCCAKCHKYLNNERDNKATVEAPK